MSSRNSRTAVRPATRAPHGSLPKDASKTTSSVIMARIPSRSCPFHTVLNRATNASPSNATLRLPPYARLGRRGPNPATSCGSHHPPYARLGRRGPSPATSCGSHHRSWGLPGPQRPENRSPLVSGPRPDTDALADKLAVAVDEEDGRGVRDPVALRDSARRLEQHRGRDVPALEPARQRVTLLAEVDREDREPLVFELPVELLDRRGQLPRAVRSAALPEIEEGRATAQVGERDRLAIHRLQGERRRHLVAERSDLEIGQEIVERVVRRGGGQQPEAGHQDGQRQATV